MPKIIKKGEKPDAYEFRGTCRKCKSVVEYTRAELSAIQYDQREQGELASVQCPTCKSQFWVYPKRG